MNVRTLIEKLSEHQGDVEVKIPGLQKPSAVTAVIGAESADGSQTYALIL